MDDIRIVECGERRAYAVEKILFFFKGEIRIFHPIFYRGAAVTGDHVFGCENFDLRNEPGACLRGDSNPGDFEKKFRFRRLFYQPVSFIAVLSFDPEMVSSILIVYSFDPDGRRFLFPPLVL